MLELVLAALFLLVLGVAISLATKPGALGFFGSGKHKRRAVEAAVSERLGPRLTRLLQGCRDALDALAHAEREARSVLALVQPDQRQFVRLDDEVLHANLGRDIDDAIAKIEEVRRAHAALDHQERVRASGDASELKIEAPASTHGEVSASWEARKAALIDVLRGIQRSSKQLAALESSLLVSDAGPYRDG